MTNKTAWGRVLQAVKQYENDHNDDNKIPRFSPSPSDVRTLLEEHTEAAAIIQGLLAICPRQASDEIPSGWPDAGRAFLKKIKGE